MMKLDGYLQRLESLRHSDRSMMLLWTQFMCALLYFTSDKTAQKTFGRRQLESLGLANRTTCKTHVHCRKNPQFLTKS